MSPKTLITAADFEKTGPETDGFELIRGELSPMPPPGELHGLIVANIVFILKTYTRGIGKGYVIGNDAGLITARDPDTVRGVDVMLFLDPQWPQGKVPSGYTDIPPDLTAEVRSPSQSWQEMKEKAEEYMEMGVPMVWIVDPASKRVTVFTPNGDPETLAMENEIEGGEALPGFRCKVAEMFEGIE